jgi:hypothetical protein
VERVLALICHAEKCQALAEVASTDVNRARFLQLSQAWLDLATTRRQMLIIEGKYTPNGAAGGNWITVLESKE